MWNVELNASLNALSDVNIFTSFVLDYVHNQILQTFCKQTHEKIYTLKHSFITYSYTYTISSQLECISDLCKHCDLYT